MMNSGLLQVEFKSTLSAEEQEVVRRSVEALRQRVVRLDSVRRATDEAVAALDPLPERERVVIAEDDPAAVAVAEALAREEREFLAAMTLDPSGSAGEATAGEATAGEGAASAADVASEVFALPFHYAWAWPNTSPPITMNRANHQNGKIEVSVTGPSFAGSLPSEGRGDAHAGCGVVVRGSRDHWVTARSLRRSAEQCRVFSGVTGAVALAEGGMEMTVLEGDRLLDISQDKRFRIRLNPSFWGSGERGEYDSKGFGTGAPIEVRWFMQAGHTYTLNVGAWVLAEWTHGPHASGTVSGARGSIVANALAITVFHS